MVNMSPLKNQHSSLTELTYQTVRRKIVAGELVPGEWLRQEDLAIQLEVSYTPIRQALDWLVADGLAERVPHKGVRITEINEDEIGEIYALRLLLDPIATRIAASTMTVDQIELLKLVIHQSEDMSSLNDMPNRRRLNREFHEIISQSSSFRTFERIHEIVWNRFPDWMFYEGLHKDPTNIGDRLTREIEEHKLIFNAIEAKDVDRAEKLAKDHIKNFMREDLINVFNINGQVLTDMELKMGL